MSATLAAAIEAYLVHLKVERRLRSEERKLPGGTRRKKGGAGSDES